MADRMIDLRKKNSPVLLEEMLPEPSGKSFEGITWTAPEYEQKKYSADRLILAGGAALLLVLAGIFLENYFFVTFVCLGYGIFLMYQKRTPRRVAFSVSARGVAAGREFYEYADLKSFWIFSSNSWELSLATKKALSPFIRIPLGDANAGDLRKILGKHIPEEEHEEYLSERIARNI